MKNDGESFGAPASEAQEAPSTEASVWEDNASGERRI